MTNKNQLPKILETCANMLGKIVTGSANQNQEAKKAQEAKSASDLNGSTPSNQPPLVNVFFCNNNPHIPNIDALNSDTHTLRIQYTQKQCVGVADEGIDIWYMGIIPYITEQIFKRKSCV